MARTEQDHIAGHRDAACDLKTDAFVSARHKGDAICVASHGPCARSGGPTATDEQVLTADEG
jgi:hypothetical protein